MDDFSSPDKIATYIDMKGERISLSKIVRKVAVEPNILPPIT